MKLRVAALVTILVSVQPIQAQDSADYTTVEGVMEELYASVTREPGEPFEWERLRAIMLPGGILLPQRAQMEGQSQLMDVEEFIALIDEAWEPIIGTANDTGFYERQTNLLVEEYGDIAHAMTTYEKGPWEPRQIIGRGINSVQLVKREGRWFVLSITWDEENTAGPLPPRYRGR